MVDIRRLAKELRTRTAWQQTPDALTDADFCDMIEAALRYLYIVTGRAALYDTSQLKREGDELIGYDANLLVDELAYVLLTAEIGFFKRVQTDVNNVFGYTTDALTITNADKPYANLAGTIRDLENERRIVYYKMTRYNLL